MPTKKTDLPTKPVRKLKRHARFAEDAFQRIRKAILNGELRAGDVVREMRIARQWNVGRTPLREAIRRAAAVGFLILRPNQAPLVRKLTAEDIRQIYSLRELLESVALEGVVDQISAEKFAAFDALTEQIEKSSDSAKRLTLQSQLDQELHGLWCSNPNNYWLSSALERLMVYLPSYLPNDGNLLAEKTDLVEDSYKEHKQIIAALKKKDVDAAKRLLGVHIRKSGNNLVEMHLMQEAIASIKKGKPRGRRPGSTKAAAAKKTA